MSTQTEVITESHSAGALPSGQTLIREILFAADSSSAGDRALEHAALLADRFGARLTLFHALEGRRPLPMDQAPPPLADAWRRAEREAQEALERRSARLRVPARIKVETTTSVLQSLLAQIEASAADLVVMGGPARPRFAGVISASLAERVINATGKPVLCVHEPQDGVALPYRRVLIATDLSHASRRAFPLAAGLAGVFGAEVVAVYLGHLSVRSLAGVPEALDGVLPDEGALRTFLEPDFHGLKVVPRIELGATWSGIRAVASAERADVIVLSTHGGDSLWDLLFGSHAERVARQAPCPVLVV